MASQLLIEGALDAKGPRGSEDRKFWKAWRRQWARFSVVYPSGRREPHLVVTLSHSSSEFPDKEIKLSRDGLRLFRCKSKSRPFRTWAIISGNKVVLYFAAESEIQAQNWMQAVRDGLWPPCFSFQMLTACSYEVSLVDDDNTFMAGHLGVYGRFVLTSEDIISLKHPHWGSTLMEISLDNIIDVLFIREAELLPAGVFSIILKRIEGSNVKALQFFCNTAKDAMQWILSKLYARRKSFSINGSQKLSGHRVSFSVSEEFNSSENGNDKTFYNAETLFSKDSELVSSEVDSGKTVTDRLAVTNLQPGVENARSLDMDKLQKEDKYSQFDEDFNELKISSLKNTPEERFLDKKNHRFHDFPLDSKRVEENKFLHISSNENTYENISTTTSAGAECLEYLDITGDAYGIEYTNQNKLNKKSDTSIDNLPLNTIRDESVTYALINKSHLKKSADQSIKHVSANNDHIYENIVIGGNECEPFNSPENLENGKYNNSLSSNGICNIFPAGEKIGKNETKLSKIALTVNHDLKFTEPSNPNSHLYSAVSKNISNNSKTVQYSISSFSDYENYSEKNYNILPNLPRGFLDISLNSLNPRSKGRGSSSSSEEDNIVLSLVNEFDELKMKEKLNEQIYEDILERKGTIYEEIDEFEDELVNPSVDVPELPKRPTNLEIPESLRLQKLSRNIQNTLEVIDDINSQKVFCRPNFIKKIKDVNRIMHLSPNQEHAKKPFEVESKLKISPEMNQC